MDAETLALARRVLRNRKAVSEDDLIRLCEALGGKKKETKSGGALLVPGKTAFLYHRPHGKYMKPGAVAEFIRCVGLNDIVATD